MTLNGLHLLAFAAVYVAALYWPRRPIRLRDPRRIFRRDA